LGETEKYMISSMTGFGRGEAGENGLTVSVEVRSVNSRFLDVTTRLPRSLSPRENDIKEIARTRISRGKVTVVVAVSRESAEVFPLRVNIAAAKGYYRILADLKKAVKSKESLKLDHILRFPEVLEQRDPESTDEHEWLVFEKAFHAALDELTAMRTAEGEELKKDLERRVRSMCTVIDRIEKLSRNRIPEERQRLQDRVGQIAGETDINRDRLELEIALLSDKLDVTEECVRYQSHNKFFLEGLNGSDPAGRRLNFLVQEMNREANTIGSKSSSVEIAHLVVGLKEELEKIREQLQNIE
jgi:uncharacterized protein (TIGR00255 family)